MTAVLSHDIVRSAVPRTQLRLVPPIAEPVVVAVTDLATVSRGVDRASMSAMHPFRRTHTAVEDGADTSAAVTALQRAALGDERAFADFYDELSSVVYGTVLRVIRNPALAEEVTQEVFLELWRQAPLYDSSKGSPKAWSCTIAHRRAVDRVRSEQSARARDEREVRQQPSDHDVVDEEATASLDRARVIDALGQLSDAQREAVTLAYYGGHTYREVAAMLDVPEGTVKSRIRDGLTRLRDVMGATP